MILRYHVDTRANLELVRFAIDRGCGYRRVDGSPAKLPHRLVDARTGRSVVLDSDVYYAQYGVEPTSATSPVIVGKDGTAALEIRNGDTDSMLGKTIDGIAIPRSADLVQVSRPREYSRLPKGVCDIMDDEWAAEKTDAEIDAEMPDRASSVKSRKQNAKGQAAIDAVLGMAKGGGK